MEDEKYYREFVKMFTYENDRQDKFLKEVCYALQDYMILYKIPKSKVSTIEISIATKIGLRKFFDKYYSQKADMLYQKIQSDFKTLSKISSLTRKSIKEILRR